MPNRSGNPITGVSELDLEVAYLLNLKMLSTGH